MSEQSIFFAALDLDAASRPAYLDEACRGNAALRRHVEELLAAHDRSGEFLDDPAVAQMAAAVPPGERNTVTVAASACRPGPNDTTAGAPAADGNDSLSFLKPATRPDSIGRLAHYEILERIGAGGFGTVLKAFDERLHRVVAIKVLAPQLASSGTARARFRREARAGAAVRDDHVVNIYAVSDENEPVPYLVMECVEGVTLQQKLDRTGPLAVKEILRIGQQIARGLAAAHAAGHIHRDIKPTNILLENGVERVKITDFGLARAADDASISQSGVVAGTPMYMSPEQAHGGAIDQRSDLFSLGSVLYALCTGRPPFRASTTMATLKRVCEDTPRPIREVNPEIPEWLCAVIDRLHAKSPSERFASAQEVADLLQQYLAHVLQPSQTPMPAMPAAVEQQQTVPKTRRQFRWAAVLLVVVGLPIVLTSLLLFADQWLTRPSLWIGSGIVVAGLVALVLSYVVQMPAQESAPRPAMATKLRWQRWAVATALVLFVLFAIYRSFSTVIDLHYANAGQVAFSELNPEFEEFRIVRADSDGSSAWQVKARDKIKLPPGVYRVEALGRAGETATRWRIDIARAFSGSTSTRDEKDVLLEVKRGERISLSVATWGVAKAPADAAGWVQLFNGKDLTGWTLVPHKDGDDPTHAFEALGEVLVVKGEPYGFLQSDVKLTRPFELRYQWRGTTRVPFPTHKLYFNEINARGPLPHGILVSINEKEANIVLPTLSGEVREIKSLRRDNEWQEATITYDWSAVRVSVNGARVVEAKCAGFRPCQVVFESVNGQQTQFRTIEVKELESDTLPDPGIVGAFGSQIGKSYRFDVVGAIDGSVWGNDVYTADSRLSAAAVHAGYLKPGQRGTLKVTILPGRDLYLGATKNGVISANYGRYPASFQIVEATNLSDPQTPVFAGSVSVFRGQVGRSFDIEVAGNLLDTCWGTDVYTDDSDLGTAAVHAGLVKLGEKARLKLTILAGQNSYTGSTRNGITTQDFGAFPGSFKLEIASSSNHAVPKSAADVLSFLAGTWRIERQEIEPKPPAGKPNDVAIAKYDFVADGKFLRGMGGFGFHFVYQFDPEKNVLRHWQAWADGKSYGPVVAVFNPDGPSVVWTHRLTSPALDVESVHQFNFVDPNTIQTRLFHRDKDNKNIREARITYKRVPDATAISQFPIDPQLPAEMKILERFMGEWRNEMTVANPATPNKSTVAVAKIVRRPILGGLMVEAIKTNESDGAQQYWLNWFDVAARRFRTWHFGNDGIAIEFIGDWDDVKQTMTWNSPDRTVERRQIVRSADYYESPVTFRNNNGKIVTESNGVSRRVASAWQPLFNGKDLADWDGDKTAWQWKDGALVGALPAHKGQGQKNLFLWSTQRYQDFEMKFKVHLKGNKGNSGVQFRSVADGTKQPGVVTGPQLDIAPGLWGNLYNERPAGLWYWTADQREVAKVLKPDDFNDITLRVVGKHARISINGWTALDQPVYALPDLPGVIGFQVRSFGDGEPMQITFKDLSIRELRPDSRGATAPATDIAKDGVYRVIKKFDRSELPHDLERVRPDGDSWRIKIPAKTKITLFRAKPGKAERGVFVFRGQLKTTDFKDEDLAIGGQWDDEAEKQSAGGLEVIFPRGDWLRWSVNPNTSKGLHPYAIELVLMNQSDKSGTVWIKDVELLEVNPAEYGRQRPPKLGERAPPPRAVPDRPPPK